MKGNFRNKSSRPLRDELVKMWEELVLLRKRSKECSDRRIVLLIILQLLRIIRLILVAALTGDVF